MRTIPAAVRLKPRNAKLSIGYRVLNVDRSLFRVFTSGSVTEVSPAYYVATNGVEVPDAGGYIVWGANGHDIIEADVQPAQPDSSPELLVAIVNNLDAFAAVINQRMTTLADRLDGTYSAEADLGQVREALAESRRSTEQLLSGLSATLAEHCATASTDSDQILAMVTKAQESIDARPAFSAGIKLLESESKRISGIADANQRELDLLRSGLAQLTEAMRDRWEREDEQSALTESRAALEQFKVESTNVIEDFLQSVGIES